MKTIIAQDSGFCFGVKNADLTISKTLKEHKKLFSIGPVIHNQQYVQHREREGLITVDDPESIPDNNFVLIRTHGVPIKVKRELESKGHTLIDLTCPILNKIYLKILDKYKEGYMIVIIGDPNHPEIIAMNSIIDDQGLIVHSTDDASKIRNQEKIYVLSQTTNIESYFYEVAENIKKFNTDVIVENTICNATNRRQSSCVELAKKVDAMIVIGGRGSSNSNKLYELAKKYCPNVFFIESINELSLQKLEKFNTIGITAGASTPEWIIEEVVKAMDNYSNEEYMEQVEDSIIKIYPKDIVKGKVIYVTESEVMVNINYRSDGIIKLDELSNDSSVRPKDLFEEGQEIDVYVIKLDDGDGNVVLSTRRVEGLKNWQNLVDKYNSNEIVEATITGENKGGLVCTVMGINGFIPASQITTYYVRDLKQYIGKEMECKIVSIDDKKRRLVLSRRVIEEEKLNQIWDGIEVDKIVTGTVARLTDFGAFVNLGGVDGLIHISDISWQRIKHPSDMLNVGDEVEVLILRANREKNRISLGLKQLTKKPFELFLENNKEGDIVTGKVVNLLDFGAFIRLDEGVEGLVHVSQISNEHVEKPSDELNIGSEIEVKILEINKEEQRIALSIKALLPEPEKKERASKPAPTPKAEYQRDHWEKEKAVETFESQDLGNNLGDLLEEAQFNFDKMNQESSESEEEN